MFLIALGASLTSGMALLAAAIYTEGGLIALRTAAEVIGWLFVLATLTGIIGLRHASFGQICAASVALSSGLAVLYMSYFFEWNQLPPAAIRNAAAETPPARPAITLASFQVLQPAEVAPAVDPAPAPRRKVAAAARPAAVANACSTLTGIESLQCNRCSEKLGLAWVSCQESVRLQYCETELGDERSCPSPIPQSYPG